MSHDPDRPDPDALLAEIVRQERAARRGRLRIFFGFSPGVGKTCAMLEAAGRLRAEGVDVVAGIVETHGREETARLLDGIETLPRLEIPYRGHVLREFDLEGAIARRPALVLVDELAHTNAPGMRHGKRWQDVFDLLESGIDVFTTLNVQHVESVVDLVERGTGIRVQETVPDTVLDRADEIELIDLPPDELLARLRDGKIYLPDVASRAVDRFFKRTNLLHLRELALLRMARRAGADAEETRRGGGPRNPGATERILVGVGEGFGSTRAIRDAARIAAGLRADWVAVHVRRAFARPPQENAAARLEANLRLAESIGARVERVVGRSVAAALLDEARRIDATRIVVGRPGGTGWRHPFRENVLDRLVRDGGPVDIVVAGEPDRTEVGAAWLWPASGASPPRPGILGVVTLAVAAALAVGRWLRPWIDDHDMSLVALLIVVSASLRFGRAAGVLAVVLSALGIDLLFLHPEFRLAIADTKKVVSLVLLLSVGLVVAELIVRMRAQREGALASERRVRRLLELSRRLATAVAADDAASALAATAADVASAGVEVMLAEPSGELRVAARVGTLPHAAAASGAVLWCHAFGRPAGRGTETLPGSNVLCLPLREAGRARGVVVVDADPPRTLSRDERELLDAAVRQTAARLAVLPPADHPDPRKASDGGASRDVGRPD